ncbi:MAG: deoxyhypusine synthase [Natrialbaceae archaeon]|nr:deoxyhypusine synthase [Natrialbaceae archaeon]
MDQDDSHDHVVPGSDTEPETPDVRGCDFRGDITLESLLETYATTGFQATQLAEAIDITERMQADDATVYLTCTSNIISSGLRETVAALVREGHVDILITTSGAIAEDVIKTAKPFKMGTWEADEAALREAGINRLGNLFVPSDRYVWLEEYLYAFFDDFFADERIRTPTAFARELGETLEDEDSVLKQAADNDVPVYCPALTDAEIGNFLYFYRQGIEEDDVGIEIQADYDRLIEQGMLADTTGLIAIGGGVPKHHAIMTNLFRGGADYVVYISTGMEGDGSLSSAPPNEAVSWGKIKEGDRNYTQVQAEATLVVPLLVAGAFLN